MGKIQFDMWTGVNEFYYLSKCGRWLVRQGNFGNMVITDRSKTTACRDDDVVYLVKGRMPEVEAKVKALVALEGSKG